MLQSHLGGFMSLFRMAALLPLNTLGHYIHWHWIDISVANFIVIVLMVVTFIVALFAPFPGRRRRKEHK
jgi:hypothetical protein